MSTRTTGTGSRAAKPNAARVIRKATQVSFHRVDPQFVKGLTIRFLRVIYGSPMVIADRPGEEEWDPSDLERARYRYRARLTDQNLRQKARIIWTEMTRENGINKLTVTSDYFLMPTKLKFQASY